jgi:hypothetical protein
VTMSSDEGQFLHELETEVEEELAMAEASHPDELYDEPVEKWLFDPTDVERSEVGLRNLLDATRALEHQAEPDN